ncbi:MAG: acyltransferase [Alphaproteobacteria bacterium]|nr:acyltransferase [Alphaproteobacteria bacterium]
MTAKGPGKASGRIAALAGARAFPPLMVVMFHFSEGHHYSGWRPLDFLATRGYLWVEFFFVLSGFILTHAYWPRLKDLLGRSGYLAFLRARLIRLYPLHLFMLLLLLAMVVGLRALAAHGGYQSIFDAKYHQDVSIKGFWLSLFLVHAWNVMGSLTWNGVSWFVSVEFALCLMFPALLWLAEGKLWRGFGLIGAGLGGLVALLLTSKHGLDITFHNGVLRGLSDFSIGVGMAVLFRRIKPRDRLPEWLHSLLQILLLALLGYIVMHTGWSHTRMDIFTVLPLMVLVFALAFDRGLVARTLQTKVPQLLGEWSYAIYLGQTAWLLGIRFLEQRIYPAPDAMVLGTRFSSLIWWLEPLGLVIVCVLWGGLLAEFIELPAAARLRGWLGRRLDPQSIPTPS